MSDYEILTIVLGFQTIITSLFIAIIMIVNEKSSHDK